MGSFWEKITSYLSVPVHRRAVILICCGVLMAGAGVGAAFAYRAAQVAVPAEKPVSSAASVTLTVASSSHKSSSSSATEETSSAGESKKADVPLKLDVTSATQDLNVNIVDDAGAVVRGVVFQLHIVGTGTDNKDYDHIFDIDMADGNLYLTWIPAGTYHITLRDEEGYITPEPVDFEVKEFVVTYQKIDDIAEQIVDESQVNVSKEDSAFDSGGASSGGTPVVTDTVPFVDPSKTEAQQEMKDANGNFLYTYTYNVDANGYLLLTSGASSDVVPVEVDGVLNHGVRYTKVGTTANTGAAARSLLTNGPALLTGTAALPVPRLMEDSLGSVGDSGSTAGAASAVPSESSTTTFTVNFVNPDGSVLASVPVTAGGTATPPSAPAYSQTGYRYVFTGWSGAYDHVQQNLNITAVYDIYTAADVKLINDDNTPDPAYQITAVKRTQTVYLYTGWQTLEGKTYYYNADHQKVTGWQIIQGISYFFNSDGVRSDCIGIDISRWNGTIDWAAVKNSGINFVIIRAGYRGYGTGKLIEDPYARQNLAGATAAGLKVGIYIFSQAVNLEEAVEEASMALEVARGYSLTYPIFIDSEYSNPAKDGRADALSTAQRTAICDAFCKTVANSGYRTGVYASKSWYMYQLNVSALSAYHIWLAHYTTSTDYAGRYDMWQYSSTGAVNGISGYVDMNLSYLNY